MIESHSVAVDCVNKILFQFFIVFAKISQYFPRICDANQGELPPEIGLSLYH